MSITTNIKKTLLVTHKDCPDGCGCAVIFRAAGGLKENIKFVPAGRGVETFFKKNSDFINSFDKILLADVAPNEKTAEKIEKEFSHVYCIDHHKSANFLYGRDWCNIDMERCGTYLLFDYLFGKFDPAEPVIGEAPLMKASLHTFAILTNDRDMWLKQHRKSNEMSLMMDFLGLERYVERAMEDFFMKPWKDHEHELLEILAEKKDKYIESRIKDTRLSERDGIKYGTVLISNHQSDVLNRIIEVYDVDCAIGIKLDGTGMVSVRSKDTFDAAEFCAKYSGGGHARSAGHPIDNKTIEEILEVIHP